MALNDKVKNVQLGEVKRMGTVITIPEKDVFGNDVPLSVVDQTLHRLMELEDQTIVIKETVGGYPYDGAHALYRAMEELYGFVDSVPTPGFFGPKPPALTEIEVGYGKTKHIPEIGSCFMLPNVEGKIQTGVEPDRNGRLVFIFVAQVKRKYEKQIAALAEKTREIIKSHSIYRGQAIELSFREKNGERRPMPVPRFMNLEGIDPAKLMFNRDVEAAIHAYVIQPLERRADREKLGLEFRGNVILEGTYGGGKTEVCRWAAKVATDNGYTFVSLERADDLVDGLDFLGYYEPGQLFAEDIDRVLSGERTINMDEILNTLDGIRSKTSQVRVVLTTNNVEAINPAALRFQRVRVISLSDPDADTVGRMIRLFAGDLLREGENLVQVGEVLAGEMPATIKAVVDGAKEFAIKRYPPGQIDGIQLIAEDLLFQAKQATKQRDLCKQKKEVKLTWAQELGQEIVKGMDVRTTVLEAVKKEANRQGWDSTYREKAAPLIANEAETHLLDKAERFLKTGSE